MSQSTDQQLLEGQQEARALWNKNSLGNPERKIPEHPGTQKIVNPQVFIQILRVSVGTEWN